MHEYTYMYTIIRLNEYRIVQIFSLEKQNFPELIHQSQASLFLKQISTDLRAVWGC